MCSHYSIKRIVFNVVYFYVVYFLHNVLKPFSKGLVAIAVMSSLLRCLDTKYIYTGEFSPVTEVVAVRYDLDQSIQ